MRWLRLYAETIDDAKLRLLAFEDRWHFIAVLCLKAQGIIDQLEPTLASAEMLHRIVAVKLGLTSCDAEEVKRRLMEVGLIDADWQPTKWSKRQFLSDSDPTNIERQRRYRNSHQPTVPLRNALRNTQVTDMSRAPDTDTERTSVVLVKAPGKLNSEVQCKAVGAEPLEDSCSTPFEPCATQEQPVITLPLNTGQAWAISQELLDEWTSLYPGTDVMQELRKMRAWCDASPTRRKTKRGIKAFVVNWLNRAHDSRRDAQHGASRPLSAVDRVRAAAAVRDAEDAAAEVRGLTHG